MIDGVSVHQLQRYYDKRGAIFKMLSSKSPFYEELGDINEVYFSYVKPLAIKGWQLNKFARLGLVVPTGTIMLVLHDQRETSPTKGLHQVFSLGVAGAYSLVIIPPFIWFGYKSAAENRGALIAFVSNRVYDPAEVVHAKLDDIKVDELDWGKFEVAF